MGRRLPSARAGRPMRAQRDPLASGAAGSSPGDQPTIVCLAALSCVSEAPSGGRWMQVIVDVLVGHPDVDGAHASVGAEHASAGIVGADDGAIVATVRRDGSAIGRVAVWPRGHSSHGVTRTLAELAAAKVGACADRGHVPGEAPAAARPLKARHAQVAELVRGGLTNKEVAARLGCSEVSVERHLTRLYRHHGVRRREELIVLLLGTSTATR